MSDPVRVARSQLANASRAKDPEAVKAAREALAFAHLERALRRYAPELGEHNAGRAYDLLFWSLPDQVQRAMAEWMDRGPFHA